MRHKADVALQIRLMRVAMSEAIRNMRDDDRRRGVFFGAGHYIRAYLDEYGWDSTPKEVAERLTSMGIKVSPRFVSTKKYEEKQRRKREAAAKGLRTWGQGDDFGHHQVRISVAELQCLEAVLSTLDQSDSDVQVAQQWIAETMLNLIS